MNNQDIGKFVSKNDLTVAEAMRIIDANVSGILFLVDDNMRLKGCITDGDIRRFLLAGGQLSSHASEAANLSPKYAYSAEEAEELYDAKSYIIIPIVNVDGKITDLYNGDGKSQKYESLQIPVVINAGGKGTRLDPFTRVLPKPLIPVGDLPIIELIIKQYMLYDCNEFHVIVNYKKQLIKAYFAENENHYDLTWADESKPLGTGGGLSLLKGKIHSTFFFATCDTLIRLNYGSMLQFHKENHNAVTMICAYKSIKIPYGIIEMGKNGSITEMKEKPELSFLTNTGMYIVEPEVLDDIRENEAIGFPDVIELQQKKGRKVAVFPISENDWMDMGQIAELEKMRIKLFGE